jgi:hypothetical protein
MKCGKRWALWALWCLTVLCSPAFALTCSNPTPIVFRAEFTGYDEAPNSQIVISGIGSASVTYGMPIPGGAGPSSISFRENWVQTCDPSFMFDPFWVTIYDTYNGDVTALIYPDLTFDFTWPTTLWVHMGAYECASVLDLFTAHPQCLGPHELAGGDFPMFTALTTNHGVNPYVDSDAYCAQVLFLMCSWTFEHQHAAFGLVGYFGSFHPTALVPLDAFGFVTIGDDPGGPVILAMPEPGSLALLLVAGVCGLRFRRRSA